MDQAANGELLNRIISRTKEYRKLMQELGYGQQDMLLSLARVLDLDLSHHSSSTPFTQQTLLEALTRLLRTSTIRCSPSQCLTHLLVSLEAAICQLRDEESEQEEEPSWQPVKQGEKREKAEKGKKKNNEKKKTKKGRPTALQEIKSKAQAQNFNERADMMDSLHKIEMLKGFLQRKVLLDLCQQSMLTFLSPQIYA